MVQDFVKGKDCSCKHLDIGIEILLKLGIVAHAFNSATRVAEMGKSLECKSQDLVSEMVQ